MLTKLFQNKKRPPRLHRVLKEEDPDKHHKLVPEVATDERVAQLDRFERNAIHIACGNPHTTFETMDILLEMFPDGLAEQGAYGGGQEGWTTRPVSCLSNLCGLNRFLIASYFGLYCAGLLDKSGRLPFHIAVGHQTSRKFLQYLIDHYPEAMDEKTKFGVCWLVFV